MAHPMNQTIQVDVISDVICPWCFLGKRRLDKALAMLPEIKAEVVFRPFYLDPAIPTEGIDRRDYMEAKFGSERLKTIHDPLIAAGTEDGVPYAFDKITRTPNTLAAHRLLRWALVVGKQREVAEALFMAYWHEGRDVGEHAVLAQVASSCGMDGLKVQADLATDKDSEAVLNEMAMAQKMGVTGVPTFIINRKYGVVGAQSAEVLADAIKKAASA
jgi:predicted DsbA family dithiol-disulfide isomerase